MTTDKKNLPGVTRDSVAVAAYDAGIAAGLSRACKIICHSCAMGLRVDLDGGDLVHVDEEGNTLYEEDQHAVCCDASEILMGLFPSPESDILSAFFRAEPS